MGIRPDRDADFRVGEVESVTRKDYELIAAAIHRATLSPERDKAEVIIRNLAIAFTVDNPRFNLAMFLAACRGE